MQEVQTTDDRFKSFKSSKEVQEIFRLARDYNLKDKAIEALQQAINKRRSEIIREQELKAKLKVQASVSLG